MSSSFVVVCAPDKLRGALTAPAAAAALGAGVRAAGATAVEHPLADGGEGTRTALAAGAGRTITVRSVDALGRPHDVPVSLLSDGTAVVEAAEAIGLAQLRPEERDPLRTSSLGLAAPVLAALDAGARHVLLTLGGSATVDGGLGLLRGLGVRLLDGDGVELEGRGADLDRLARLDRTRLDRRLGPTGAALTAAVDVSSPLHGPEGAAVVYGPQKGAGRATVARLDAGLARLEALLGPAAGVPGAGAAGGLGAAVAYLGGATRPGIELVLEVTRFADRLDGAGLCLTAEGRVDRSSLAGKTVGGVLAACRRLAVPCVVLGGRVDDADALLVAGAAEVRALGPADRPLDAALAAAAHDLAAMAATVVAARRVLSGPTAGQH